MHIRSLASLVFLVACSGHTGFGFDAGDGDGGDGGGGLDSGCPFCGVDASGDAGGTPTCSPDPGNFDVPGNNCDDDGDGVIDNPQGACDTGLQITGPAGDMAKAIGLCQKADATHWGVVSAAYTTGYKLKVAPDANQTGILTKFGNTLKPRQGSAFGVLSSGWAREYDQCSSPTGVFKGGCSMQTSGGAAPPGYPKDSPSCPSQGISPTVNDVADLALTIKVPNNAKGIAFDFNFGSGEWPEFVCTEFNDSFIAYLSSAAFNGGKPDNVSFDSNKNPVSVNNAFFDRCSPKTGLTSPSGSCTFPSNTYCVGGDTELKGTGFYNLGSYCGESGQDTGGGMTGWLTTQAPVQPAETITLEFMVWDTGDHIYDSSVLIDNWQWQASATSVSTGRPPN